MAKKLTHVELPEPSVMLNTRSDLKEEITKYWLNRENSNIGVGLLTLKDGKVTTCYFYRSDLASVQYFGICNCFIGRGKDVQLSLWPNAELEQGEKESILSYCQKVVEGNKDFWLHENKFLDWFNQSGNELNGKTPEQAITILTKAGF